MSENREDKKWPWWAHLILIIAVLFSVVVLLVGPAGGKHDAG